MKKQRRVVVIGAGVGGLTAAALLAKSGYEVTVLEAHVYAGGCAGTFFHKGFRFDAGATVAGGFQPGGPHHIVGEMLGLQWDIERTDPSWIVHLPDRTITAWSDDQRRQEEHQRTLPELHRFWGIQQHAAEIAWKFAARIPEFPPRSLGDVARLIGKIRPDMIPIAPLALLTMGQLLDVVGVDRRNWAARTFIDAQLLISAQTTADRANALYGAIAIDLPRTGTYHVKGGMGGIAKTLAESLLANGGQVIYRHAVTQIAVQPDGTFCLETNKGHTFAADIVLANLTPWALDSLLGDQSPTGLQREVQRRRSTWGAFTLYLGIPLDMLPDSASHFQIVRSYDQPLGEGNSVFVSISDPADQDRAPAGYVAVTLSTHTQIDRWWQLRETDPDGYQARIAQYRDRLLDALETVMPNVRQRAKLILPGTPAAFQRFTRRPAGMVGGFPMTSLFTARSPHTAIPNLWMVGDSVFPGQSTAGVTAGALRVAAEVLRS
ncbi:MAG: FAD-dependent oxidoreductase [Anaerolineae bacterium]|nr:FAD-dependent oxidoreductase [Anaerolineae bacterium]